MDAVLVRSAARDPRQIRQTRRSRSAARDATPPPATVSPRRLTCAGARHRVLDHQAPAWLDVQ